MIRTNRRKTQTDRNYLVNIPVSEKELSEEQYKKIYVLNNSIKKCDNLEKSKIIKKEIPEILNFLNDLGFDLTRDFLSFNRKKQKNFINSFWTTLQTNSFNSEILTYEIEKCKKIKSGALEKYNTYESKSKNYLIFDHIFSNITRGNRHNYIHDSILKSAELSKNIHKENSIFGGYLKSESNILWIDLDNHNNTPTNEMRGYRDFLIHYFGESNRIFEEQSKDYGYHIAFKLSKKINIENHKKILKDFLNTYKNFITDKSIFQIPIKMRFPFSHTYTALKINDDIGNDLDNNFFSCYEKTKNKLNFSKGFNVSEYNQELKIENSIYTREHKGKYNNLTKEQAIETILNDTDYDIYAGERNNMLSLFVHFGKRLNLSEYEVNELMISKSINSKDLSHTKGQEHNLKCIEHLYKNYKFNYDSNKLELDEDIFFSNYDLIPENIKIMIGNDSFISKVIIKSNHHTKVTQRNIKIYKILLFEILGKFFYNIDNQKLLKNKNLPEKLLIGEQFSKKFCELIKNKYDILKHTDVYHVISAILRNSSIFKQFKSNSIGYYYDSLNPEESYCRQFTLTDNINNDIKFSKKQLINHILNSINSLIDKFNSWIVQLIKRNKINYIVKLFNKEELENDIKVQYLLEDLMNTT